MYGFMLCGSVCKKLTAPALLLCVLMFPACSSSSSDDYDTFYIQDFDFQYPVRSGKFFNFTQPASISDSGEKCLAVTWEGEVDNAYYYGFSVRKDGTNSSGTFELMVWFKKDSSSELAGNITKNAGDYWVSCRYQNTIYSNPSSNLDITINKNAADLTYDTEIKLNSLITLTSPSTVTIQADESLKLRSYR